MSESSDEPTISSSSAYTDAGATGFTWLGAAHVCRNACNQLLALSGTGEVRGRLQAFKLTSRYAPGTVGASFNFVAQFLHLGIGNGGSGYLAKLSTHPSYATAFNKSASDGKALRFAARGELIIWRLTLKNAYESLSMSEFGNFCGGLVGSQFGTTQRTQFMKTFAGWQNFAPNVMVPQNIAKSAAGGAIFVAAYVTHSMYVKYKDVTGGTETL
jgi:hypothetical protein